MHILALMATPGASYTHTLALMATLGASYTHTLALFHPKNAMIEAPSSHCCVTVHDNEQLYLITTQLIASKQSKCTNGDHKDHVTILAIQLSRVATTS